MKEIIMALLILSNSQQLANIISVKGSAQVIRAGVGPVEKAVKGLSVFNGDVVKTEKNSEVVLAFKDGSTLNIYENTETKVEKKEVASESSVSKVFTFFKLAIGKIRAKVRKVIKGSLFSVVTPTSTMGVRGTDFTVASAVDGSTVLEVKEGKIDYDAGKMSVEGGKRVIFDVEKGIVVQSTAVPFNYNEWAMKKLEEFKRRQKKLLKAINRVMQERLKRFQGFVEQAEQAEDEENAGESISEGFVLKEMFEHSINSYRKRGIKPGIENRFRAVADRFSRIERAVRQRYRRKKQRIERKLQKKQERIEKHFKEIEEKLK